MDPVDDSSKGCRANSRPHDARYSDRWRKLRTHRPSSDRGFARSGCAAASACVSSRGDSISRPARSRRSRLARCSRRCARCTRSSSEFGVTVDEVLFDQAPPSPEGRRPRRAAPRGAGPGSQSSEPARPTIALKSGVTWERLMFWADEDVEFIEATYEPGGASGPSEDLVRHSGHEFGYVLSGTLRVVVGFDEFVLEAGDSITFPSSTPHRLSNEGTDVVRAIWVVRGRRAADAAQGDGRHAERFAGGPTRDDGAAGGEDHATVGSRRRRWTLRAGIRGARSSSASPASAEETLRNGPRSTAGRLRGFAVVRREIDGRITPVVADLEGRRRRWPPQCAA